MAVQPAPAPPGANILAALGCISTCQQCSAVQFMAVPRSLGQQPASRVTAMQVMKQRPFVGNACQHVLQFNPTVIHNARTAYTSRG